MSTSMKLLIAYDDSVFAKGAIDDLRRAGLPREVKALVMSIANVLVPPLTPDEEASLRVDSEQTPEGEGHALGRVLHAVHEAHVLAERGSEHVRAVFPNWTVEAEACGDSPAWALVKKADEWKPDLVVVGSHSRSVVGRIFFGSVSQKVLSEAHCSVRVARAHGARDDAPVRLVVGVDGSRDAKAAVRAVAARAWPSGTEALVVTAVDEAMATAALHMKEDGDERAWIHSVAEAAAERLRAAGITATPVVRDGDPKHALLEEAEHWRTDCIFMGARGIRGLERFLLGSVSAAVAARAHCSVEVVRTGTA
jgi:nucleotide-binding universal stress UspA family protein